MSNPQEAHKLRCIDIRPWRRRSRIHTRRMRIFMPQFRGHRLRCPSSGIQTPRAHAVGMMRRKTRISRSPPWRIARMGSPHRRPTAIFGRLLRSIRKGNSGLGTHEHPRERVLRASLLRVTVPLRVTLIRAGTGHHQVVRMPERYPQFGCVPEGLAASRHPDLRRSRTSSDWYGLDTVDAIGRDRDPGQDVVAPVRGIVSEDMVRGVPDRANVLADDRTVRREEPVGTKVRRTDRTINGGQWDGGPARPPTRRSNSGETRVP